MLLCFVCLFFFVLSFLYSVIRYRLSSPPRIATLTASYNGLCNLIQEIKCVCTGILRFLQSDSFGEWAEFSYSFTTVTVTKDANS